ncbi:ParB family chromosome partitioning protein [Novosphingobium sp. PhB55]|uniref:ParB/RepB/Spo0J family partition protein n=1 Tax=Novosphingobium sp. PhB55 TaxID=2485106 RepID=UPI0010669E0A|nr:ParB/RepB/Spo0J family partition protein [Novosphingobium sp. PhB55]TDW67150.1 ParB family chromosome partitioning protein [Novosphingobium sp. PhB55]
MARKQSDYLAALLSDDDLNLDDDMAPAANVAAEDGSSPAQSALSASGQVSGHTGGLEGRPRTERTRGTTLLGRESALARVATGEVRQVTQLLLDPARVRIWPGNARSYAHLSEESCQELIDSIIAEGGQKVPAVVRRVEGDADHDYEVIAGTRRHWSISWLRGHSYPDMQFVAQVAQLDDEAAFRLADLENRARKDVSDLERARNYAQALRDHYGNHMTRMAERLKLSKGWLSKMLKVAAIPDAVLSAFASPADVQLKPAYPLAQLLDDKDKAAAVRKEAARLARDQAGRRADGRPTLPAADVLKALLSAPDAERVKPDPMVVVSRHGRTMASVQTSNRQGVTLRLHAGSGASRDEVVNAVRNLLIQLDGEGRGLQT